MLFLFLAEAVRFELTEPFDPTVFKTVAIDHSATLPLFGAANRVRTGDIHVGNVMLYQLSYSRIFLAPGIGIEPILAESKSVVLPLHYPGIKRFSGTSLCTID